MVTSLTRVPRNTRGRGISPFVACSASVGTSGRVTLSKGVTSDSTLDDVFATCDGSQKPGLTSLISFRGVGGTLLRSEQMSSKSNSSSASFGSRLLLKVWLILAMDPLADILVLIPFLLFLGVT